MFQSLIKKKKQQQQQLTDLLANTFFPFSDHREIGLYLLIYVLAQLSSIAAAILSSTLLTSSCRFLMSTFCLSIISATFCSSWEAEKKGALNNIVRYQVHMLKSRKKKKNELHSPFLYITFQCYCNIFTSNFLCSHGYW